MWRIELHGGAELRPLEPWRAAEFLAHVDRARAHTAPWIPIPHRVRDLDTARAVLQEYADFEARDGRRLYGIWLDGLLVGGTSFPVFDATAGSCEIGVWLEPAAEGRGLVTAACTRMIDWVFGERGMHRVEWHTDPDNARSKAVAARLGMTYEGTLRSAYAVGGGRHDTEIWSLLAREWPGVRAAQPAVGGVG